MKILNFGSCNIDKVYKVNHICSGGETISSDCMNLYPGGKGLNQSIALARAGATVYHAGCIGEDGGFLKDLLKHNRVDVTYLREDSELSGHAIIQVDKTGENSILIFGGTNLKIERDYIDEVLNNFEEGSFLILQNEISNVDYIVDKAYEKGLKIFLNPSPFNEKIKNIDLNKISYMILNETEAYCLSGTTDTDDFFRIAEKKYPNLHILLTLGKKGSIYRYKNESNFQPSFLVDSVDTTGAGDTYTGFFIAGISKATELSCSMRIAAAASAIAVSRHGASSSIPTITEVEKEMVSLKVAVDIGDTDKKD